MSMDKKPVIRTLLCHGHAPMAARCLASLARCHRQPFRTCVHDDGTLTDDDRARLAEAAPDVTFVDRAAADAQVAERLAGHPACLAYRRAQVMALKLFDVVLLAAGEPVYYCDGDILFARPFEGFAAALADAPRPLVLMRDLFNTYSLGWRRLLRPGGVPLADRVNAGIMLLDPAMLDLDFVEWFLRRPEANDLPAFAEQTAWSALVQRSGGSLLDPAQFAFPRASGEPPGACRRAAVPVAWHFVAPLRGRFPVYAASVEQGADDAARPPERLRTFRPARLNFPRYGVSRWRKGRLARQLARAVEETPA